jgi:AcrR family transcriptional regulator
MSSPVYFERAAQVYSCIFIMRRPTPRPGDAPRPRNAAATRDAILNSAQAAFARAGYDGAGVREIAAGAGVTAMLVNRYFGSKEQLFTEVIATTMARPTILTKENLRSPNLSRTIATILVDITNAGDTPLEGFLITLRSASSRRAAEIGRAQIESGHHKTMTAALPGALAPQRAALVLALVSGVQVMRQMIGLSALAKADPGSLIDLLEAMLRPLIEPPRPLVTTASRVRSRSRRKS